jgi:rubrerythrin
MTFYRCSHCQYTTTDAGVPECPHCHAFLNETDQANEDWLEKNDSFPASNL